MNDLSDKMSLKSDQAIGVDIGAFIKAMRLKLQKTQSETAKEANISRSTLSLMESGEMGSVSNLIKVLRVLNQLDVFQGFEVNKQISPLVLAKAEQKQRQRVSRKVKQNKKPSSW